MRFLRLGATFLAGACLLGPGQTRALTPHDHQELEFPLEWSSAPVDYPTRAIGSTSLARTSVLGPSWFVQPDPRTGIVHMAWGSDLFAAAGIGGEADAVGAARNFLLLNSELAGTRENNLALLDATRHEAKWAVHFRQEVRGVPVWRAEAFVLLAETGQVAAFGSDFFPEGSDVVTRPSLSEGAAIQAAAASIGAVPDAARPQTAELWLVPAPSGELMELTPAYRTVFETAEPFGRWETFVNAVDGTILARRNLYHAVNVIGNVEAVVQNQPPSYGWCDGSVTDPLEHVRVNVQGGNNAATDENGDFDIVHGGSADVTVTAQLLGPYSNINRFTGLGADASFSGTATPGVPLQITWNGSNSRQDERTTFWHANRVHDFVTGLDSNFTELDYSMPSVIGRTDGFCPGNAWWDGTGMNYCEAGGGQYANTGELGNVIYHEFGHGVTQEVYTKHGSPEPPGDMHEGNSDVIANFLDRNSIIGIGFFSGNCVSGIRDANNSLQWPQDNNGGHFGGQIIAGFHWDSWQSMLGVYSQAEADSIAFNNWHYARDMGRPSNQPSQVLWNFMMDDDNADLNDGTPNHAHYCLGAENHGFMCPEILTGVIITHTPLGHTTDGGSGFDVVATITSTETLLDPAQVKVLYRVDGGSFSTIVMSNTGVDEYTGHIPSLAQDGEIDYYIFAQDLNGNQRTHPATAPQTLHSFDVCSVYDDLEGGVAGWTVGVVGDNATTGIWENVDPIGTSAQPEDDSTPSPGVLCFVTGQCSGPNCGGGCTLGCNDVDNGTTTLLSPVYDLSGATSAKVKYDRWYSNNTGNDPNNDFWVVHVSNDGGSNWTQVENTNASNANWTTVSVDINALFGSPNQVQLRFRASDLNAGSLVEAAVDELRILQGSVGTDVPSVGAPAPLALSLEQNQPNPFRPETKISYAVPARADVELVVYNVSGQAVRKLESGPKAAGRYEVRWDGRDAAGQRVAAGVYFYRLVAGGQALTKKMTVMK